MNAETLSEVLRIFKGSNGDETKAFYQRLEKLGPAGIVAMNLFRAQKCSSRAKVYRRRAHKTEAYGRKQWSMGNLCAVLSQHAGALGIRWGWKHDPKQSFHDQVLYVDLPTGQASFHSESRGEGPEFSGRWDCRKGGSEETIIRYTAHVISGLPVAKAPTPESVHPPKPAKVGNADLIDQMFFQSEYVGLEEQFRFHFACMSRAC